MTRGTARLRVAAAVLVLAAGAATLLAYRAGLAMRIVREEHALEDVRGGMEGLPWVDTAAWVAHTDSVEAHVAALRAEHRRTAWLWLPILVGGLATGLYARRRRPGGGRDDGRPVDGG